MKNLVIHSILVLLLCGCRFQCNKDHIAEGYEDLNQGKVATAIDDFAWALGMDSSKYEAYRGLALCYLDLKDYNKALQNINIYISSLPNDCPALNDRGNIYLMMGEYDKAITDFSKVIELDSTSGIAYYNKAEALRLSEKYQDAIATYTKLLGFNKNDARAYYKRGLSKLKSGQKEEACLDLKEASVLGDQDAKKGVSEYCK